MIRWYNMELQSYVQTNADAGIILRQNASRLFDQCQCIQDPGSKKHERIHSK
jgi:hypothetical protein